jgi:hypothetical protein
MVNSSDEILRTVYLWFAPGGDRDVLKQASQLLEPVPEQPAKATFAER